MQTDNPFDFGAMSVEQIIAAFDGSGDETAVLGQIQTRANAIARQARANQAYETAADRRALRIADLREHENERDNRMQAYRAIADQRLQARAEDAAALDKLLAYAIALARGGEIDAASNVAKVAGLIARAAKQSGAGQAPREPVVQFIPGPRENSGETATIAVSVTAARASLTRLIDHALRGDTIIIERANVRIARIVPYCPGDCEEDEPAATLVTSAGVHSTSAA